MKTRISTMIRSGLFGITALALSACASMDTHRQQHPEPSHRLEHMLGSLDAAIRAGSACYELWEFDHATVDCERIQREVDRLYMEFPQHPQVMLASAVLNYRRGRSEAAQFLLDQLLAMPTPPAEAALLRARIALESGNTLSAADLLQRQLMLAPNRFELHEAQAAVHYLNGRLDRARSALGVAGRLGAPAWRLSYHHGLLSEAEQRWDEACRFYARALEQRPDHKASRSRLLGLSQHLDCQPAGSTPYGMHNG